MSKEQVDTTDQFTSPINFQPEEVFSLSICFHEQSQVCTGERLQPGRFWSDQSLNFFSLPVPLQFPPLHSPPRYQNFSRSLMSVSLVLRRCPVSARSAYQPLAWRALSGDRRGARSGSLTRVEGGTHSDLSL